MALDYYSTCSLALLPQKYIILKLIFTNCIKFIKIPIILIDFIPQYHTKVFTLLYLLLSAKILTHLKVMKNYPLSLKISFSLFYLFSMFFLLDVKSRSRTPLFLNFCLGGRRKKSFKKKERKKSVLS